MTLYFVWYMKYSEKYEELSTHKEAHDRGVEWYRTFSDIYNTFSYNFFLNVESEYNWHTPHFAANPRALGKRYTNIIDASRAKHARVN